MPFSISPMVMRRSGKAILRFGRQTNPKHFDSEVFSLSRAFHRPKFSENRGKSSKTPEMKDAAQPSAAKSSPNPIIKSAESGKQIRRLTSGIVLKIGKVSRKFKRRARKVRTTTHFYFTMPATKSRNLFYPSSRRNLVTKLLQSNRLKIARITSKPRICRTDDLSVVAIFFKGFN